MGRPHLLDSMVSVDALDGTRTQVKLRDRILGIIRNGVPPMTAAIACGVGKATWFRWKQEAGQGDKRFKDFWDALEGARAQSHAVLVGRVTEASKLDWRAAMAVLERTDPENWSQTVKVQSQVERELEAAINRLKARLPDEVFQQVLAILSDDEGGAETAVGTVQ